MLLPAGAVAAVAGKSGLATSLIVAGVVGGGVGVLADARAKALKAAVRREREIASALRLGVCTVAEARIQDVGVDAVDPGVLERALQVEDDQLPYITRGEVDECLRKRLAEAYTGNGRHRGHRGPARTGGTCRGS